MCPSNQLQPFCKGGVGLFAKLLPMCCLVHPYSSPPQKPPLQKALQRFPSGQHLLSKVGTCCYLFVKGFALEALEAAAVLVCFLHFFKAFAPFWPGSPFGAAWQTHLEEGCFLAWLVLAFFLKAAGWPASHLSFSLAASLLARLALEVVPPPSFLPWLLSQTHPLCCLAWQQTGVTFFQRLLGGWREEPFYKGSKEKNLFTKVFLLTKDQLQPFVKGCKLWRQTTS